MQNKIGHPITFSIPADPDTIFIEICSAVTCGHTNREIRHCVGRSFYTCCAESVEKRSMWFNRWPKPKQLWSVTHNVPIFGICAVWSAEIRVVRKVVGRFPKFCTQTTSLEEEGDSNLSTNSPSFSKQTSVFTRKLPGQQIDIRTNKHSVPYPSRV